MKEEELVQITGGHISATFISAVARGVNTIYDLGRAFGSAVRRVVNKKTCAL